MENRLHISLSCLFGKKILLIQMQLQENPFKQKMTRKNRKVYTQLQFAVIGKL